MKRLLQHIAMLPLLLWGLGGILCTSCSHADAIDDGQSSQKLRPIRFQQPLSADMESAAAPHRGTTRADEDELGLETEANDFIVFASKCYADADAPNDLTKHDLHRVLNYCKVTAESNGEDTEWVYDQVENPITHEPQNLRYWDYDAVHFRFCAFAPYNNYTQSATMEEKGNGVIQLKIPNVNLGYVRNKADGSVETEPRFFVPLYTKPCEVKKADYGKPVKLTFKHVFSKVRVGFCMSNDITSDDDIVTVNNIYVKPTEGMLTKEAHVLVTYDERNADKPIDLAFDSQIFVDALTYHTVECVFTNGTKQDEIQLLKGSYYLFPSAYMSDTQRKQFVFYANVNDVSYHVAVDKAYTAWEPNKEYTYIFKINNAANVDNVIRLYSVEVEEWKAGGDAETKNDDEKNVTEDW